MFRDVAGSFFLLDNLVNWVETTQKRFRHHFSGGEEEEEEEEGEADTHTQKKCLFVVHPVMWCHVVSGPPWTLEVEGEEGRKEGRRKRCWLAAGGWEESLLQFALLSSPRIVILQHPSTCDHDEMCVDV